MRRTVNVWWVIAVVACVFAAFFFYSSQLTETIEEMQQVIEEGNVRLAQLQARNAELEATLKSAGTDAFVENQARNEYGYMMPDEIRFVITNPEALYGEEETTEIPSP